jgi:3-dehydroquinate synthase
MRHDKKAEGGMLRFVLLDAPGRATVRTVPDELVEQVLEVHTA